MSFPLTKGPCGTKKIAQIINFIRDKEEKKRLTNPEGSKQENSALKSNINKNVLDRILLHAFTKIYMKFMLLKLIVYKIATSNYS